MICAPDDTARGTIHSNLALCYLKLKDYAMATTHADVAMCLRPGWEKGYFRHGETAFEQRDYATALKDYEEAVKCAPNDVALKHRVKLAKEASNGFYFRQLLPGRDIAVNAKNPIEQQIFGAATQMQNFIYLVGDARTRECVAIDACWDVDGILAVAKNDKMRITKAVATHYHFDHVGGKPPPPFDALGIEVPGIKQLEAAGLPNPVVIDANMAALIAHSVVVSVHAINAGKDLQSLPCSVHGAGTGFPIACMIPRMPPHPPVFPSVASTTYSAVIRLHLPCVLNVRDMISGAPTTVLPVAAMALPKLRVPRCMPLNCVLHQTL